VGAPAGKLMRSRAFGYELACVKLMVLRPLSLKANAGSGESVWITVQVERQPSASRAAELSLALSTSTRTVPAKVVWIAVLAAFKAIMSTPALAPATLVLMLPVMAPAAVEVSYALNPPITTACAPRVTLTDMMYEPKLQRSETRKRNW